MKNVAIITGGDSKEFDISLKSAETVFKNIDREKYNPYLILIKNDKWEIKIEDKLHDIDSSLKAKIHGKELNFKPYSTKKSLDNWIDILKKWKKLI